MHGIRKEIVTYKKMENFWFTHMPVITRPIIGTAKSTLRIPPQHNGVMPIKISGAIIEMHMAYFLTDDNTPEGKDPNTQHN